MKRVFGSASCTKNVRKERENVKQIFLAFA